MTNIMMETPIRICDWCAGDMKDGGVVETGFMTRVRWHVWVCGCGHEVEAPDGYEVGFGRNPLKFEYE